MKIAHWFALMMFLATGSAMAQPFNVATNTPARFPIPVDRPSQIVVTVQFTGSPINISVIHPNGQKTGVVAYTSPGRFEAPATANETRPGMVWQLEISTAAQSITLPRPGMPPPPRPQLNPTASGTVNIAINPPPPPPPPPVVVPVITGLSKNPVKPGEELIISGRGFGSGQNGVGRIFFSSSPSKYTETLQWSDSRIRIVVPPFSGRDELRIGLKTNWSPANGNQVESQLVPITIQLPPLQYCFGSHTRGDAAWQIACYPGLPSCNANRASYLAKSPSVEALPCAEEIYCYSFGDRVNNGPFGYKLNSCYSTTAACEADRKGRIIIIGGKDSSCSRSMHSGPPGHD